MERIIHIIVNTIENFVKRETVTIGILVYHDGALIGESDSLVIEPDFHDPPTIQRIDFFTELRIDVTDRADIEAVVSVPLIVQVIEHEGAEILGPTSSAAGDGKKRDKKKSARKLSGSNKERKVIGVCNVDMIPIILGEKNVVERLVLEEPKQSTSAGSSWLNLPVLTVTLTQEEPDFLPPESRVNYLLITVESIHNPPASFTEGLEYKAATIIHTDEEVETVIFEGGKYSKYRDVELTKRWRSLSKLEGRGRLSKYKIDCHYGNTKNPLTNVDLQSKVEKDNPRIEWNYMSRHVLFPSGQEVIKDQLNKYGHWPFQFKISSNISETVKTKLSDSRTQIYQCYADVSELLYPGRTQTRTVAQLYTLSTTEMMEKTGFDKIFFDDTIVESKSRERKGKLGTKGSSINLPSMPSEPISCLPLKNEFGEPAFVVLQFEVHEAFSPSRKIEDLECNLTELLGPPDKLSPYPYTGDLAEEQYTHCVRELVQTIVESYRDFNEEDETAKIESPDISQTGEDPGTKYFYIPDEIDRFTQYLYDNGIYVSIRTTLKKKVVRLLDQKFKTHSCTWDSEESQNFVANVYAYLVEQMHVALNSDNDNRGGNEKHVRTDNACYYAEENYELGNVLQAKNIYTDLIARKRNDPEAWLTYAIFSKKVGDDEKSLQCCREAVSLDSRHKLALLLYGVLLAEKQQYSAAEIFFRATTQLYPRFAEAWGTLHLFFLRTEFFPGVDLTIRVAEDCLLDQSRDTVHMDCLEYEPLAWTTIPCPENRVYLILAVFLLRLNLFDFAGIALAQELSLVGRSTPWLYYMAVHHYLLARYEDALTHLKEAQNNYGLDYSISALMGHCHFKEGNVGLAMECYEFASTFFDRPTDIHLVHLRMANYLVEVEDYSRGKKILLHVCKTSPTASSWFGLGVVCYQTADFKDAEVALSEANRLDPGNPEIWAYLCLLNITLQRYEEFAECYRQTVKNDLQNPTLWLRIKDAMESLGLSSPMLPTTESTEVIEESSENITSELE